jgi:hypothetical protein
MYTNWCFSLFYMCAANLTSRGSGTSLARFIFETLDMGPFAASAASGTRTVGGRTFTAASGRPFRLSHMLADSDSDDESPLSDLMRVMRHSGGPSSFTSSTRVVGPSGMTHVYHMSATTTRSYASNRNDANAGNRVDNPLEIEDSSDDEEVQVVRVTHRRS